MSALSDFLAGVSVDAQGRALADILAYSDAELERRHDFIQWLFPLPDPSRAVPGSPVLSGGDIAAIRASDPARRNLEAAAGRMLAFYEANDHWLGSHDHNHLRITRIIRSLRLLVGDSEANGFRDSVRSLAAAAGASINPTTLAFWDAA
ncbi:MAG: hypothetical protein JWP15_2419 [Alphaproteobacteria bacterium]|nr:hypothetical protein [Alphaproteobacteria bacterium]